MNSQKPAALLLLGGVVAACLVGPLRAELIVNHNLGPLPFGSTNVVGDTSTGANNADIYAGLTDPALNWGNEVIYSFSLSSPSSLAIAANALAGDPDFFLLNSLATGRPGLKNEALGAIKSPAYLDTQRVFNFGALSPGTYYLSVDSFIGADGGIVPGDAAFDVDLHVFPYSPAPAPTAVNLGRIAGLGEPIEIDTLVADFDTELALYDSIGAALRFNDDDERAAAFQSALRFEGGLPLGEYFIAVGGFDAVFEDAFVAVPGDESGNYALAYNGGVVNGFLDPAEIQYYRFTVGIPEPSSIILLGWAVVPMCCARRRRKLNTDTNG